MSFIWTRKVKQVVPAVQLEPVQQVVELPVLEQKEDKISIIEHKEDGKCLVSSCEKDDAFGSGEEEVNGEEVVQACVEVSEVDVQEE